MTIRKRIKHKWHFTVGNFELKAATYHPDGRKSLQVYYQNNIIGYCLVNCWKIKRDNNIYDLDITPQLFVSNPPIIGTVCCRGIKKNFPSEIIKVTVLAHELNMLLERKVLFEKNGSIKLINPVVYIREPHFH